LIQSNLLATTINYAQKHRGSSDEPFHAMQVNSSGRSQFFGVNGDPGFVSSRFHQAFLPIDAHPEIAAPWLMNRRSET
jgi:hypothetical protein